MFFYSPSSDFRGKVMHVDNCLGIKLALVPRRSSTSRQRSIRCGLRYLKRWMKARVRGSPVDRSSIHTSPRRQ